MMFHSLRRSAAVMTSLLFLALPGAAQTSPTAEEPGLEQPANEHQWGPGGQFSHESREEFLKRMGLTEDPGADPDSEKIFVRNGAEYQIHKYERRTANFNSQPEGWVRPFGWVNASREVYQQTESHIWVFEPVIKKTPKNESAPPPAPRRPKLDPEKEAQNLEFLKVLKAEFSTLTPPDSALKLKFRDASAGLPAAGSWRNSADVADMNGDGHLDLILPPQRSALSSIPIIYLGDGKGNWKEWEEASYPIGLNYGSVVAGDLNGDKKQDLVLGVHLHGVAVFLGNGKGYFTDASPKSEFPTRRVLLHDVDGDKDLDILAISEGPRRASGPQQAASTSQSNLRVYVNDGKAKFTEKEVAEKLRQVAGDYMAVGDFNADGRADVVGSSIYYSGPDLFYLGGKEKLSWTPFGRGWLPFSSYYNALTSGKFTSARGGDVILSFVRHWPKRGAAGRIESPELSAITGIERVTWEKGEPRRTTIARWEGSKAVAGMGNGDFDGDGRLDLVYSQSAPRDYVFLMGDGKGGFARAKFEGIEVPVNIAYDIKVADVNRDKRPDLIFLYEAEEGRQDGAVKVYLNEGIVR
jgi:hypothetical protein